MQTVLEGNSWTTVFKANGLAEDTLLVSKYIKDQLEWPELPAIVAGPPTDDDLKRAWSVSRRVPLREIFLSLGLDVPEHLALPFGLAEPESFLAPDDDEDDDCPIEALGWADTEIPPVPLSPGDEPLGWIDWQIDARSGGWMKGWMDGRVDGCMHRWAERWMS